MITCEQAVASELASRYVSGQMDAGERDSYEQHYFQCARCFDDVQFHMSLQSALKAVPRLESPHAQRTWVAWGAIAATVIVMASIGFWRLQIPRQRRAAPVAVV